MNDNTDCDVIHDEVVEFVREEMHDEKTFNNTAMLFKMFSDNTRLKILFALSVNEMCVCDIAVLLNMTKSAISHQLKQLRLTNLVKTNKQGKVVFYSLADEHVRSILAIGFEHMNE